MASSSEPAPANASGSEPDGATRYNPKSMTLSDKGAEFLKGTEEPITGLYDDSAGICSFGVGQVVHTKESYQDKSIPCLLLNAANATDDDAIASHIKESKLSRRTHLSQSIVSLDKDKADVLRETAAEAGENVLAMKLHGKEFFKLTAEQQSDIRNQAKEAVDREWSFLPKNIHASYKETLKDYINKVRNSVDVPLSQPEFDALVHFAYNPGGGFKRVCAQVNKNLHRNKDERVRSEAFREIGDTIKSYVYQNNKNDDTKERSNGLIKRREAEAVLFTENKYLTPNQQDKLLNDILVAEKAADDRAATKIEKERVRRRMEDGSFMMVRGHVIESCKPWLPGGEQREAALKGKPGEVGPGAFPERIVP